MCCPTHNQVPSVSILDQSTFNATISKIVSIAGKVSAIALGVLAYAANPSLFFPYFALGMMWGMYDRLQNPDASSLAGLGTSPGFVEQLTGARLPSLVCLGLNVALVADHIDHHSNVLVPTTALATGAWAGQIVVDVERFVRSL